MTEEKVEEKPECISMEEDRQNLYKHLPLLTILDHTSPDKAIKLDNFLNELKDNFKWDIKTSDAGLTILPILHLPDKRGKDFYEENVQKAVKN